MLGGEKRNHDTLHRLSRRPTEILKKYLFISTSANCCLPSHCVMGYCFQHNQTIRQRICCTLSLGEKCSVTMSISGNIPCSYLDTGMEKMCCSSNPQGKAGTVTELVKLPLQWGGEKKGLYVPFLLPNKSWEFIFTWANYLPKTMQGRFSLAYSVSVWACLNIEKSKIFIILLDSNSSIIIITYDYLCQSFLASFLWPLNCKSF